MATTKIAVLIDLNSLPLPSSRNNHEDEESVMMFSQDEREDKVRKNLSSEKDFKFKTIKLEPEYIFKSSPAKKNEETGGISTDYNASSVIKDEKVIDEVFIKSPSLSLGTLTSTNLSLGTLTSINLSSATSMSLSIPPISPSSSQISTGETPIILIPSKMELNLKWLQEFILERLTKDATVKGHFDSSDVQWTYKFFDSSQPTDFKSCKRFLPLNTETFEVFEKDLQKELDSFISSGKNYPEINELTHLSSAIKNIVSDVNWGSGCSSNENISSSEVGRKKNGTIHKQQRNLIYSLFRVPRDGDELLSFVGDMSGMTGSQNFINALLPKAFFIELHRKHKIRVNFVDMWYFHENCGLAPGKVWNSSCSYAKPIPNVLHYLGGGKVYPITKRKVEPELPPWIFMLKALLQPKLLALPSVFEPKNKKVGQDETNTCRRCCSSLIRSSENSGSSDGIRNGESARKGSGSPLGRSNSELIVRSNSTVNTRSNFINSVSSEGGYRNGYNRTTSQLALGKNGTVAIPNTSYLQMNNPKRPILVPRSWVQMVQREQDRTEVIKKALALPQARRPTPKKVRRNLFSVQTTDHKDIQSLIAMTSCSNFTRSPARSFYSPGQVAFSRHSCSPFSSSNETRLKVLKSKRRLHLDDEDASTKKKRWDSELGVPESPDLQFKLRNADVICPESPATPPKIKTRRNLMSSLASSEKKVVQESPESLLPKYSRQSPSGKIDSTSFYSLSTCDSFKSKAWEKSGIQLKVAKIKESVELSQLIHSTFPIQDSELLD